jgi:hypothetical protein
MTSLVFIKTLSAISQSNLPSQAVNTYNADSVYAFQVIPSFRWDTAAYCACLKGIPILSCVSGLATGTLYYAVIYLLRDSDNLYSIPTNVNGLSKQGPPAAISTLKFTGLGQTTARVNWLKPGSYSNSLYSTLVFLKQSSAINAGSPSRTVTSYTANANFLSAISSKYQNDSMAKCIYKGDTNFVNVTGLLANTDYHVLIYVIRDLDSTYSASAYTNGSTLGVPAYRPIAEVNANNPKTGDADSVRSEGHLKRSCLRV